MLMWLYELILVERNMESIPKMIRKLSAKKKKKGLERDGSRDSELEDEKCSLPPPVFSDIVVPKFKVEPLLTSSECLRYAIAEAVSNQLFNQEKIYVKPNQIITSLINATGAIAQTNPKKYNKTKIILKDQGNPRTSTQIGSYWEVRYYTFCALISSKNYLFITKLRSTYTVIFSIFRLY